MSGHVPTVRTVPDCADNTDYVNLTVITSSPTAPPAAPGAVRTPDVRTATLPRRRVPLVAIRRYLDLWRAEHQQASAPNPDERWSSRDVERLRLRRDSAEGEVSALRGVIREMREQVGTARLERDSARVRAQVATDERDRALAEAERLAAELALWRERAAERRIAHRDLVSRQQELTALLREALACWRTAAEMGPHEPGRRRAREAIQRIEHAAGLTPPTPPTAPAGG